HPDAGEGRPRDDPASAQGAPAGEDHRDQRARESALPEQRLRARRSARIREPVQARGGGLGGRHAAAGVKKGSGTFSFVARDELSWRALSRARARREKVPDPFFQRAYARRAKSSV